MAITITALGDAAFLTEVLNGVAMVFATDDIKDLVKVGFMLGFLLVGLRGIMKASMEMHHMLLAFIIYAGLFAPKVDQVEIYDPYSGVSYTVDNVPLGVAYTGKLLSAVGMGLTELMEQAFSPIDPSAGSYRGLLDEGFLDPLKILINLRYVPYNPADPLGQAMHYNLQNHVMSCTGPFIMAGKINEDQLPVASDLWSAIRVNSPVLTQLYKAPDTGLISEVTCRQAADDIDAIVGAGGTTPSGDYVKLVNNSLNAYLKFPKDASGNPPADPVAMIQDYTESLAGVAGDAFAHTNNQIIIHSTLGGLQKFGAQRQDLAYAFAVQTSKQRRDFTHAAEGSMFMNIMRPMMSFLESIVYALSPLMAFLVVIGPQGIGIAGKYLLLTAWMQLWLPVLAVVKLYVYMSAHSELSGLMTAYAGSLESIEAAWLFQDKLQSYLGISGLLVGMVPVISLMLISGGAVTANAIASRLTSTASSAASTAAGALAPSPMSASAGNVTIGNTQYSADMANGGKAMMGITSPSGYTTMSFGESAKNSLQAGAQQLYGQANKEASSVMDSLMRSDGFKTLTQAAKSEEYSQMGAYKDAYSSALKAVESADKSAGTGFDQAYKRQLAAALTASGGAGVDGKVLSGALGAMLRGQSSSEKQFKDDVNFSERESNANEFTKLVSAEYAKSHGYREQISAASSSESGITQSLNMVRQRTAEAQSNYNESVSRGATLEGLASSQVGIKSPQFQEAAERYYGPSADRFDAGERFAREFGQAVNSRDTEKMGAMAAALPDKLKQALGPYLTDPNNAYRPVQGPSRESALDWGNVAGATSADPYNERQLKRDMEQGRAGVESNGTPSPNGINATVSAARQRVDREGAGFNAAHDRTAAKMETQTRAQLTAMGANEVGDFARTIEETSKRFLGGNTPGERFNELSKRTALATEGAADTAVVAAMAAANPDDGNLRTAVRLNTKGSPDAGATVHQAINAAEDRFKGQLSSEQYEQVRGVGGQIQQTEYQRQLAMSAGDLKGVASAENQIQGLLTKAAGGDKEAGQRAFNGYMKSRDAIEQDAAGRVAARLLTNAKATGTVDSLPLTGAVGFGLMSGNVNPEVARNYLADPQNVRVSSGRTNQEVADEFAAQAQVATQGILLGAQQQGSPGQVHRPEFDETSTRSQADAVIAAGSGVSADIPSAPTSPQSPAENRGSNAPQEGASGQEVPQSDAATSQEFRGAPGAGVTPLPTAANVPTTDSNGAMFGITPSQGDAGVSGTAMPQRSYAPESRVKVGGELTDIEEFNGATPNVSPRSVALGPQLTEEVIAGPALPPQNAVGRELANTLRGEYGPSGGGMGRQSAGDNTLADRAAGMEIAYASAESVGRFNGNPTSAGTEQSQASTTAQSVDAYSDPTMAAQQDAQQPKRERQESTEVPGIPAGGTTMSAAQPQLPQLQPGGTEQPKPEATVGQGAAVAPTTAEVGESRIAMEVLRQVEANTGITVASNVAPDDAENMTLERARAIVAQETPGADFDKATQYAQKALFTEEMNRRFGG